MASTAAAPRNEWGTAGIWSRRFRHQDRALVAELAQELDRLGYRGLWVQGGLGGDLFDDVDAMLSAAPHAMVATAVLNVWMHDAIDTACWVSTVREEHPGRLVLGLGASHEAAVGRVGRRYARPLATVRDYVSALESAPRPVSRGEMMLAALGPRMLALAAERTAGSHTYAVTPRHTSIARGALGPDALLVPELKVLLEEEPARARATAREHLAPYLRLPNYTNNLVRLGFAPEDLAGSGSDRLVDSLVAWGDPAEVAKRVDEHLAAGADHVAVQVIDDQDPDRLVGHWTALAPALIGCSP